MTTCLLVIDIQRDYFDGGAFPLPLAEPAAAAARDVLEAVRRRGDLVIHVRHVWDEPDATFMRPGTAGIEIHPLVAPLEDEIVIDKAYPNALRETPLLEMLGSHDVDHLLVTGMMTNMCVDGTVRAAADLGFDVTLVHDACAAADLEFGGRAVEAADVHAAFVAALDGEYAEIVDSASVVSAG
jgi:nicotinamidase-related amidase